MVRKIGHWEREEYIQRMTIKEWEKLLLEEKDRIIFQGRLRQLIAEPLGYGIVEIAKKPL